MNKCKCDLCKCETEQDYINWFYKEVKDLIKNGIEKTGMTFEQNVKCLLEGIQEYIYELEKVREKSIIETLTNDFKFKINNKEVDGKFIGSSYIVNCGKRNNDEKIKVEIITNKLLQINIPEEFLNEDINNLSVIIEKLLIKKENQR